MKNSRSLGSASLAVRSPVADRDHLATAPLQPSARSSVRCSLRSRTSPFLLRTAPPTIHRTAAASVTAPLPPRHRSATAPPGAGRAYKSVHGQQRRVAEAEPAEHGVAGRRVDHGVLWAIVFVVAVAFGVGVRRWKGDTFRSNVVSNVVMWVGTAIGYFLVADRDDRSADETTDSG